MTTKQRIEKLEKERDINRAVHRYKYICIIHETSDRVLSKDEGYTVQCCPRENGGTGGDPIHFVTRAELDDFAARPDVDLTLIRLVNDRH
jgi:hypothetical protein